MVVVMETYTGTRYVGGYDVYRRIWSEKLLIAKESQPTVRTVTLVSSVRIAF